MKLYIDYGFAYLKALSNDKKVIFPSVSGNMLSSINLLSSQNGLGITTDNGQWLFGQDALDQSIFANRSQDMGWFTSDEYKAGILAAISEFSNASRLNVELMLALPFVAWESMSKAIIEKLEGQHNIKRNNRNSQQVNISFNDRYPTFPQNLAPFFVHFLSDNGKPNVPDVDRDIIYLAIFNGGGNTIEYSTVKFNLSSTDVFPIGLKDWSGTTQKGIFNLTVVIKNLIWQEYKRSIDDYEAFKIIRTGKLEIQNKDINVSNSIRQAIKEYYYQLMNLSDTIWQRGSKHDKDKLWGFILSGGQGPVLKEFFRGYHSNLMMSDNPQFDVVEGMKRLSEI